MSIDMNGVNYFDTYSNWMSTVTQESFIFKKQADMFEYSGYVRSIYSTTKPSHYTMIITRKRKSLVRTLDVENTIEGHDKISGLSGNRYLHYLFFASARSTPVYT